MSRYDSFDPNESRRGNIFLNPGFRFGFFGALLMIVVNLLLLLIFGGDTRGDLLSWIIQLFIYFLFARTAAESQYSKNTDRGDFEHLRGVQAAGIGSALVTSILMWIYIIIRGVMRDAFGMFIIVEPFSLFCLVIVDVLIALGIGAWAGNTIVSKYRVYDD
jgi:hypothetical protein